MKKIVLLTFFLPFLSVAQEPSRSKLLIDTCNHFLSDSMPLMEYISNPEKPLYSIKDIKSSEFFLLFLPDSRYPEIRYNLLHYLLMQYKDSATDTKSSLKVRQKTCGRHVKLLDYFFNRFSRTNPRIFQDNINSFCYKDERVKLTPLAYVTYFNCDNLVEGLVKYGCKYDVPYQVNGQNVRPLEVLMEHLINDSYAEVCGPEACLKRHFSMGEKFFNGITRSSQSIEDTIKKYNAALTEEEMCNWLAIKRDQSLQIFEYFITADNFDALTIKEQFGNLCPSYVKKEIISSLRASLKTGQLWCAAKECSCNGLMESHVPIRLIQCPFLKFIWVCADEEEYGKESCYQKFLSKHRQSYQEFLKEQQKERVKSLAAGIKFSRFAVFQ